MYACTLKFMDEATAGALRTAFAGRDPSALTLRDIAKALHTTPTGVYRRVDSLDEVRRLFVVPAVPRQTFTEAFVARAAGPEQVGRIVSDIVGDKLEIGPLSVGPKSVKASATARGVVGRSAARARGPLTVRVDVPVDLDIEVTVGRNYHRRFDAWLQMPLTFDLAVGDDLILRVRPRRPRPDQIAVSVAPAGMSVQLMRRIGRVDTLLRTHALAYLDGVLATAEAQSAMAIDLGRIIDDAWGQGLVFG